MCNLHNPSAQGGRVGVEVSVAPSLLPFQPPPPLPAPKTQCSFLITHLLGTETVQTHIMQSRSHRKDKVGIIWIAVQVNGCLCYYDKYICVRAQERFSDWKIDSCRYLHSPRCQLPYWEEKINASVLSGPTHYEV